MRVAVTGASGFVGGTVVRALRELGHAVVPFGRRAPDSLRTPMPGYRQWDIESGPLTLDVDALVHCAARVSQWGAAADFWRSNVYGTANVLASAPPTSRLVYISTASVYPHSMPAFPIREAASAGTAALSLYGRSKLAGEALALAHRSSVVLRPHIVYGPGDTTLWPRVVAARRSGCLRVPGTGMNRVSVTHVHNLASAVACALHERARPGVYNVADGEAPTVDELLRTMFRRHGMPTTLRYVPRAAALAGAVAMESLWSIARRAGDPPLTRFAVRGLADHCVLDTSRARSLLHFDPAWSFRDGPL